MSQSILFFNLTAKKCKCHVDILLHSTPHQKFNLWHPNKKNRPVMWPALGSDCKWLWKQNIPISSFLV